MLINFNSELGRVSIKSAVHQPILDILQFSCQYLVSFMKVAGGRWWFDQIRKDMKESQNSIWYHSTNPLDIFCAKHCASRGGQWHYLSCILLLFSFDFANAQMNELILDVSSYIWVVYFEECHFTKWPFSTYKEFFSR